jgi:alpha-tubulin suppressor-like RCC1 family protein
VSLGPSTACAVTAGSAVECWGRTLGSGSKYSAAPVQVTGLTSGVTALSIGPDADCQAYSSACAVTAAGGVVCWGSNCRGQLGNGSTTDSSVPVPVTGLTSGVVAVSVGNGSVCAVTAGGGVQCWGALENSGADTSVPVPVPGLASGVIAVSADAPSYALTASGDVVQWGLTNGQWSSTLVPFAGFTGGVTAISGDDSIHCAVTAGGGLECWGASNAGELGNGSTTANSPVPVQVTSLTSGVTTVSVGSDSACAITADGAVQCWGDNGEGELGNGSAVEFSSVPVPVTGL